MWGDGTRTQDVMLVDEQVSPALTLTLTNLDPDPDPNPDPDTNPNPNPDPNQGDDAPDGGWL